MRYFCYTGLFLTLIFLTSCAAVVPMDPPLDSFNEGNKNKVDTTVGYFISEENLQKRVKRPGGQQNPDIIFYPYKAMDTPIHDVLSKTFSQVFKIPSLTDKQFIQQNKINYILVPEIEIGTSGLKGMFGPATLAAAIMIECEIMDGEGHEIRRFKVLGEGKDRGSNLKTNKAAKLAAQEVLTKLQVELRQQFLGNQ